MVEIKLEALDLGSVEKDTYVAVRVGENQKLSRLVAEKSYKIPKSALGEKGDRKYGKVDIFKKIGSATIGCRHDPDVAAQEIEVPLGGDNKVKFRVTLKEADPPAKSDFDGNQHLQNAKSYLTEHNLEMVLSDAMQAVLRERPLNPSQFIAEKLTTSEGGYRRVPGDGGAQTVPAGATRETPAEEAAQAPEELRMQAKQTLLQATANGSLDTALAQVKETKDEAPDTEALRQQAKATLMGATQNGSLDASLQKLKDSKDAPAEKAEAEPAAEAPAAEASSGDAMSKLKGLADASVEGKIKEEAKPADDAAAEAPAAEAPAAEESSGDAMSKLKGLADASVEGKIKEEAPAAAPEAEAPAEEAPAAEAAAEPAAAEAPAAEAPAAEEAAAEAPAAEAAANGSLDAAGA